MVPELAAGDTIPSLSTMITIPTTLTSGTYYYYACVNVAGDADSTNDCSTNNVEIQVTETKASRAVFTGSNHSCAIAEKGEAWCWGDNGFGKLGDNSTNNRTRPVAVVQTLANAGASPPISLTYLSGATHITVGIDHSCAILSGAAWCWGSNSNGRLGGGRGSRIPVQVTGLTSDVTAISAGFEHTCAIHNGAAKCWGNNGNGRLGDNSTTESNIPVQVTGLTNNVSAISGGATHTCAIHDGAAKCWGDNDSGRLGNNTKTTSHVPVQVTGLNSNVTDISAGEKHACAVHSGAAKCWGKNGNGQLGNNTTSSSSRPVDVVQTRADTSDPDPDKHTSAVLLNSGVTAISAGDRHTCAIHNGTALCWGARFAGKLGDGNPSIRGNRIWPVQVSGLGSDVSAISAGDNHTCAVHNGIAKCWGTNSLGILGNGGASSRSSTPVRVLFP